MCIRDSCTCSNFVKFSLHVPCGCDLVLCSVIIHYVLKLIISEHVMFLYNDGMLLPLQHRVRADSPAESYWLYSVPDDSGHQH